MNTRNMWRPGKLRMSQEKQVGERKLDKTTRTRKQLFFIQRLKSPTIIEKLKEIKIMRVAVRKIREMD